MPIDTFILANIDALFFVVLVFATSLATSGTSFMVLFRLTNRNSDQIQEIYDVVNQQRRDMVEYQKTLIQALEAQGIDVPINPHPLD